MTNDVMLPCMVNGLGSAIARPLSLTLSLTLSITVEV